jgi:lysyl-tRNA synthetase class 2
LEDFSKHATRLNLTVTDQDSWDDIFYKIFLTHIEKHLGVGVPTFLYDYPAHMAALAVKRGKVCERFEAYIQGIELCNAFSELNDAVEQRERFIEEKQERVSTGKNDLPLPEDFLKAMEAGMPKAAGNALGLDRMFMILMNKTSLKDVLPFPDFWES